MRAGGHKGSGLTYGEASKRRRIRKTITESAVDLDSRRNWNLAHLLHTRFFLWERMGIVHARRLVGRIVTGDVAHSVEPQELEKTRIK